jgi:hypothetical protein
VAFLPFLKHFYKLFLLDNSRSLRLTAEEIRKFNVDLANLMMRAAVNINDNDKLIGVGRESGGRGGC